MSTNWSISPRSTSSELRQKSTLRTSMPTLAATFATALLFSAGHVLADNPPNEPEENAQNDSSQPVTDTWITTKVKADLLATENVSGLDIKVETVDGVVTLTGAVASQAQKDKAVEVARQIKGVKRVEAGGLKLASR